MAETYYEVILRIPVDSTEADPAKWSWEEILDTAVEVINTEQVEGFKSPEFQLLYNEA